MIDQTGVQVGVVDTREEARLDLVEIAPNEAPPVCRIMDFGKHLFDANKRRAANKKKQKQTQVKEIKFRPVTDIGDYNVKLKKIIGFLERGDKVKISIRFRGREMQHRELGLDFLKRVEADLPENMVVEQDAKLEGRQLSMVVALGKTKK